MPQDHGGVPGSSPAEDPSAPPHGPPPPPTPQGGDTGLTSRSHTWAAPGFTHPRGPRRLPNFPRHAATPREPRQPPSSAPFPGPAPRPALRRRGPLLPRPLAPRSPAPARRPTGCAAQEIPRVTGPEGRRTPFFLLPEGDTRLQPGLVDLNTQGPGRLLGNPEECRPRGT